MTIVKNPDILLCDETIGALDYNTSKEILMLIETVNKNYNTTIYDEAIVQKQVDEITDRLEKASEQYASLYMTTGQKPSKDELSAELDDFLIDIIEDAVNAEINGEEYEMPENA